jgi:hypothetical protein
MPTVPLSVVLPNRQVFLPDPVQLHLRKHVTTLLSHHHQAFQTTDPMYQHLQCIMGSQKLTIGGTVNILIITKPLL